MITIHLRKPPCARKHSKEKKEREKCSKRKWLQGKNHKKNKREHEFSIE
jgi:hypothetical protein